MAGHGSGRRRRLATLSVVSAVTIVLLALAGGLAPSLLVACVKFSKLVMETGDEFTQVNNNILLFDRQDHPFVPTSLPAEHRAQRQSRKPPANAAAPAQPARHVLDRARTVLG
jgi:hypothetical protein